MSSKRSIGASPLWLWLFRQALLLHPPRVRAEYGSEMEDVFRTRVEEARKVSGGRMLLGFQMREVKGLIRTGLEARWEVRNRRGQSAHHPQRQSTDKENGFMTGFVADIRVAWRSLRKAPGFTLSAVIILALGIGANITAFSALKVAVLTPPPFPEADRLVSVDLTRSSDGREWLTRWSYPYVQKLADWPDRLIDPVAGYRERVTTLTGFGPAVDLNIEVVSPGYFDVVGYPLTMGRGFVAEEADPSGPYRVTVVSYAFWQTQMGRDPSVLGREIELNGVGFQVVGVAAPNFLGFTGRAVLWLPTGAYAVLQPGVLQEAENHLVWVVGRLRPGATLAAADAQMEAVGQAIAEEWHGDNPYGAGVRSFADVWKNPDAVAASVLLLIAAGLVLLVACANLAGLLFTRALRRVRESAVRRALGASRWRLIRSFLVESVALTALGGLAGLGLSLWGMRLLTVAWPAQFLQGNGIGMQVIDPAGLSLDARVIALAVLVSLGTALLIGLIPALRVSSFRITDYLKDGAGATRHRGGITGVDPQAFLVGAQVSLALMLLVGVGLMGSTVGRLLGVDAGFRTDRLLSFEFSNPQTVPRPDFSDAAVMRSHTVLAAQFDNELQRRMETIPGIEGMALSSGAILKGFEAVLGFSIEDGQSGMTDVGSAGVMPVSDNYFDLLGIPVVSGRVFDRSDGLRGAPVVVLSQTAAARYFPNQDPIGKRITTRFALPGRETAEVVGVVGDVIYTGPANQRWPVVYYSLRERSGPRYASVRTTGDPSEVIRLIQNEIFALDPTIAMRNVTTMDQLISGSVRDRRLVFWLLTVFATITVLLAAAGTWGVVAYSVAERRRELGLRIALGAETTRVLRLVLRRSTLTALVGVVLGLAGAWAFARVLEAFLWNTSAHDPRVFVGGGVLLFIVVLAASYLPARRAVRLDPVEVLRAAE
jgi:putative ABC transport system permease protein